MDMVVMGEYPSSFGECTLNHLQILSKHRTNLTSRPRCLKIGAEDCKLVLQGGRKVGGGGKQHLKSLR